MKVKIYSKARHTEVVDFATVIITVEEARTLYTITERALQTTKSGDFIVDEKEQLKRDLLIREFTRSIAKKILITSGENTPMTDILRDLKGY
jgi:hypothetical protein